MLRTINTIFAALIFCFTMASCEKEYSAEGIIGGGATGTTGGTAVFTLDGAPNTCSSPTINGTYMAGTAMTGDNTVILVVNVTTAGTYTISTNQANGVSFTGAGTFTATGVNFIELSASGTPTAAGTINYLAGSMPCSFPVTFTAASTGGTNTGTGIYACTNATANGTYTAGTALTVANTISIAVNVTTPGTFNITTGTTNGISFSGSGTFAGTGAQMITLTGTGTPATAGQITYSNLANGCSLVINVEAGTSGSTSAYLINCSSIQVNGTYTTGVSLDASNTVTLTATVTTAGTYTISTSNNGITFVASGTFAAGSDMPVTLFATGSPTMAGANAFTVGSTNCPFTVNVIAGSSGSTDFLKATISGTVFQFNNNLTGFIDQTLAEMDVNGDVSNTTGTDNFDVDFVNSGGVISTGTYSNPSVTNTTKFVVISYIDNAGVTYAPQLLTSNNSTATITTINAIGATGTFSGTLTQFDPATQTYGTQTKVITNGSFAVTF